MAANATSLRLTEGYRQRLLTTRLRLERQATALWPTIRQLDDTDWADRMAGVVRQAQAESVRVTGGYLTAFLGLELGARTPGPVPDSRKYAGLSRDGRPLAEALGSPLIGVKAALAGGRTTDEALAYGLHRATRMVSVDFDHAHRSALLDAIESDNRFDGWTRAVRGTCGACAGKATGHSYGLQFQVHPGCQCVSEPVVKGTRDRFPRPTGTEIFAAKSTAEQDDMLGPEAAEQVRSGEIELADLVEQSPLATDQPNFITQAAVATTATQGTQEVHNGPGGRAGSLSDPGEARRRSGT